MANELISDAELIKSYLNNNEASFKTLLDRYKNRIFSSIYFMVHDRAVAEDIFQDTLVKVIITLKEGKYNEQGKFLPWVLRIAHNLVIDKVRKNKREPVVKTNDEYDVFGILGEHDESYETKISKYQSQKDLRRLIFELPLEQREVVILRNYANLSFKEISKMTGVSINTSLGRMRYALNKLRNIIKEKDMVLEV